MKAGEIEMKMTDLNFLSKMSTTQSVRKKMNIVWNIIYF